MNYSPELKESLLRRMLPPNNESISKISKEEGISEQTLRNWRDKAKANGMAAPGSGVSADDWSTQDKFLIVVETAGMNETELAEYARKKGVYVELTLRRSCRKHMKLCSAGYYDFKSVGQRCIS